MIELTADWWHPEVMLHPLWLVVNALAAFRLTRLLVVDAVPFGLLRTRISDWAIDRWEPGRLFGTGAPMTTRQRQAYRAFEGQPPLAYFVSCSWCVGMYVGVPTAVVAVAVPTAVWVWLAVPLAFSAVTGLLSHAADK